MRMRKKEFTAECILDGALQITKEEGFSNFGAREVAKKVNMSTQPIYLSFKNMDDLRSKLLERIASNVRIDYFQSNATLISYIKNVYSLSKNDWLLFHSLSTDRMSVDWFMTFLFNLFHESLGKDYELSTAEEQMIFSQIIGTITSLNYVGSQVTDQDFQRLMDRTILKELQFFAA
jgi:AcrR family transcriptional regulator